MITLNLSSLSLHSKGSLLNLSTPALTFEVAHLVLLSALFIFSFAIQQHVCRFYPNYDKRMVKIYFKSMTLLFCFEAPILLGWISIQIQNKINLPILRELNSFVVRNIGDQDSNSTFCYFLSGIGPFFYCLVLVIVCSWLNKKFKTTSPNH
jgi:hypothetical protein